MRPEERVRLAYYDKLVAQGEDPQLIVIEKKISELPHLSIEQRKQAPNRRIDLLCYRNRGGLLLPHLLVECKAVPLQEKMKLQLMGYNYYVRAPFLVLVSSCEELFWAC